MDISGYSNSDMKIIMELKESRIRNLGLYNVFMNIYDFQQRVLDGIITDDGGVAKLVIHDEIRPEYNVGIERRVISRDGQIISFAGLLKLYRPDELQMVYIPKSAIIAPD